MTNEIRIAKNKRIKLFFILTLFFFFNNAFAEINNKTLSLNDFIIIEITEKDFNRLDIQKNINYTEFRYISRYWIAYFISNFKDKAKYILLDAFINDYGIKEYDDMLIKAIKESNNSALIIDGFLDNEHVWTLDKFRNACKDIGSTVFINKKDIITVVLKSRMFAYVDKINMEGSGIIEIEENKGRKIFWVRHTSLIILEHLGYHIKGNHKINIKKEELLKFKKISFSEALSNPDLIENKIVLLTNEFENYKDEFDFGEYGKFTGPEVVCNIILNLAYYIAQQKR